MNYLKSLEYCVELMLPEHDDLLVMHLLLVLASIALLPIFLSFFLLIISIALVLFLLLLWVILTLLWSIPDVYRHRPFLPGRLIHWPRPLHIWHLQRWRGMDELLLGMMHRLGRRLPVVHLLGWIIVHGRLLSGIKRYLPHIF